MSTDKFFFEFNDNEFTAKIGVTEISKDDILIPKSIKHDSKEYIITGLIYDSFKNNYNIKTISFAKDSKIQILDDFKQCHFQAINIPPSVTSIEIEGFFECKNLKFVNFLANSKLSIISKSAFSCSSIQSITIPASVTKISSFAFSKCACLKSITFGRKSELDIIDQEAFSFSSIEQITIPSKVTVINEYAFKKCENLKSVIFEKKSQLLTIKDGAFHSSGIERIEIPPSVETICRDAFAECKNLKSVTFGKNASIRSLGDEFIKNTAITRLDIPADVDKIDDLTFCGAKFLTCVTVSKNPNFCIYKNNLLLGKQKKDSDVFDVLLFVYKDAEQIEIPPTVVEISLYAFAYCENLKTIQIPENSHKYKYHQNQLLLAKEELNESDNDGFNIIYFARKDIKNVTIPSSIAWICPYAFYNCKELTSIKFYDNSNLVLIWNGAFESTSLNEIVFPKYTECICPDAFKECNNLKKMDFSRMEGKSILIYDIFPNNHIENMIVKEDQIRFFEREIIYVTTLTIIDKEVTLTSSHLLTMSRQVCLPNASSVEIKDVDCDLILVVSKDAKIEGLESNDHKIEVNYLPFIMSTEMVDQFLGSKNVELGTGATATVYRVNNIIKGTGFLALKTIKKEICLITQKTSQKKDFWNETEDDEDEEETQLNIEKLRKYYQEYEILSQLYHPNIIRAIAFTYGDKTHLPSILLEYCRSNLMQAIDNLEDYELVCVIYEICSAMKYIHENHIIHRDLKLQNILINSSKHVKISDFGISTLVDSYTQTTLTVGIGTSLFMAPELFQRISKYNYKVDVYAFGVILFFILTKGQFPEGTPGNLYKASIPPSINALGASIIRRCWSLSPEERPDFDEIIKILLSNNFQIIDGIEEKLPLIKDHLKLEQKNFGNKLELCLLI